MTWARDATAAAVVHVRAAAELPKTGRPGLVPGQSHGRSGIRCMAPLQAANWSNGQHRSRTSPVAVTEAPVPITLSAERLPELAPFPSMSRVGGHVRQKGKACHEGPIDGGEGPLKSCEPC